MKKLSISLALTLLFAAPLWAASLKVGDAAPAVELMTHEGKPFSLQSRQGLWTVLYFYPKANTPGCTKQACAFRDSIKKIRELGAEVYGISGDDVKTQAKFHEDHRLNFLLLADHEGKVMSAYGTKKSVPLFTISNRVTFIVSPTLKIAAVEEDVDPILDAEKVATKLKELQKK